MMNMELQKLNHSNTKKFKQLWHLVGNTPMLEILYTCNHRRFRIYAKCEHYNFTGSIKDRIALFILQQAYRDNQIKPGDVIVEATSGNTGIAFSAIGKALGHDVKILMPDWMSRERIDIVRSLGAEVVLVSKAEGGFVGSIARCEQLALDNSDVFLPRQFDNFLNASSHELTTGQEICQQLESCGVKPLSFVAGVGTGGTVMGVGRALRRHYPGITIHPLEPKESPTLTTGYKVGSHRIQGISDEFIPSIVDFESLDHTIQVSDGDAILMAQKLSHQLGLAVGISSGANFVGAVKRQQELNEDSAVVTIFCDSNKKYLSTDLMRTEPEKPGYWSPQIQLLEFNVIDRGKD
jgi:cysteine synthase A